MAGFDTETGRGGSVKREWTSNLGSLTRGVSKDLQKELREAADRGGWTGARLKSGHIMLRHVRGGQVLVSSSSGDRRSFLQVRTQMRRAENGGA